MEEQIVNRVLNSKLITIDLEEYYEKDDKVVYDITDELFQGLILREKEFRQHIKENDWSRYEGKYVAITCSADAIVPTWAYMILAVNMRPYAKEIVFGNIEELDKYLIQKNIAQIDGKTFENTKVVIKGCGDLNLSAFAYVEVVKLLQPYCSSIMYGEPCSTVPVYKKKSHPSMDSFSKV